MPNRRTHARVGCVAGASFAADRACSEMPAHLPLGALGVALGGRLGACLPDVLDPPVSPRHRSAAHGVVRVACAVRGSLSVLDNWQARLRTEAHRRAVRRDEATSLLEVLWHALLELLCRLASGALAVLRAGHASHVVLDALTPAGLPLIA